MKRKPEPPIAFIPPRQPEPDDTRPHNAFGFLLGFGEAYAAFYAARDQAESRS